MTRYKFAKAAGVTDQMLREIFNVFDIDGDGHIEPLELQDMMHFQDSTYPVPPLPSLPPPTLASGYEFTPRARTRLGSRSPAFYLVG